MKINRIVPDITMKNPESNRDFYGGFLGLDLVMDQGWVMTFASPANPTSQITFLEEGTAGALQPDISIDVDDIQECYSKAQGQGLPIEYPLTEEPWGVTRFFVRDPNGKIVNLMAHTSPG